MNRQFRICLIIPKGYQHSLLFAEPIFLLRGAFEDLGVDYDVAVNELAKDKTNVVLGYHLLSADSDLKGLSYIPYQFEQLGKGGGVFDNEGSRRILKNADEVWDYSEENVDILLGAGVKAKYLPLGYHEALEVIDGTCDKEIDVLFFGSMNDRRRKILQELESDSSLKVVNLFGVYGSERDKAVARSKVNLHIHYYDTKIYQQLRVAHFANNRSFVVSEEARDNPYREMDICQVPYEQLVETCKYYVRHPEERDARAERAHEQFKSHYHMTQLVGNVLSSVGN